MPFKSLKQERAAFGGYLGPEMKRDAKEWASKTNQSKLPEKVERKKQVEAIKKNIK